MERENKSEKLTIGAAMPAFKLDNIDGRKIDNSYFKDAKASLVAFSCNHCPYVKGSDEMLISVVKKYQSEGLKTIAISSNDAVQYPEDGFEKMKEKAKNMNLPFPYLYDESQEICKKFDAECTPEFFLFDSVGNLAYHGTINDSPRDATKVTKNYLSTAIEQVLAGEKAEPSFVRPIGCSIKWKQ
jgi:peroxiredoxin